MLRVAGKIKPSGFAERELDVAEPEGPDTLDRPCGFDVGCVAVHSIDDVFGEQRSCLYRDSDEECVVIGEVPVCGIGRDADGSRDLAEAKRSDAAATTKPYALLDEGRAEVAAAPRAPLQERTTT